MWILSVDHATKCYQFVTNLVCLFLDDLSAQCSVFSENIRLFWLELRLTNATLLEIFWSFRAHFTFHSCGVVFLYIGVFAVWLQKSFFPRVGCNRLILKAELMWWMRLERQTSRPLIENWDSVEMMLLIFTLWACSKSGPLCEMDKEGTTVGSREVRGKWNGGGEKAKGREERIMGWR